MDLVSNIFVLQKNSQTWRYGYLSALQSSVVRSSLEKLYAIFLVVLSFEVSGCSKVPRGCYQRKPILAHMMTSISGKVQSIIVSYH